MRSANFTAVVNFFWACRDFARGVNVNSSTSIVNSTTELADLFVGNSTCGEAKMYTSQNSSEHRLGSKIFRFHITSMVKRRM